MLKSASIILLFVLAITVQGFTQDYNKFAGIPFGATRQTVAEELLKRGYEPYGQSSHGNMGLSTYQFGELLVQIEFLFNQNDKFYAFEIRTGRVEEARLPKVFEAVSYMSEQFDLKYKKHASDATLTEKDLHEGRNIYEQWFGVRALDAYTSIIKTDSRYFAIGNVTHRALAKEKKNESGEKLPPHQYSKNQKYN